MDGAVRQCQKHIAEVTEKYITDASKTILRLFVPVIRANSLLNFRGRGVSGEPSTNRLAIVLKDISIHLAQCFHRFCPPAQTVCR